MHPQIFVIEHFINLADELQFTSSSLQTGARRLVWENWSLNTPGGRSCIGLGFRAALVPADPEERMLGREFEHENLFTRDRVLHHLGVDMVQLVIEVPGELARLAGRLPDHRPVVRSGT